MSRWRLARRQAALLACVVLLTLPGVGCSFSQSVPKRNTLVLPGPLPVGHGPGCGIVRLHRVRAESPFERKAMVYRIEGNRYVLDPYNEFFAPPGRVIRQQAGEWLTQARVFDMLIEPGDTRVEDWLLVGSVSRIYVDRAEGQGDEAVLDVTFTLLERRRMLPVFERTYGAVVDVEQAGSLGAAWADAVSSVLRRLETDLRVLVRAADACSAPAPSLASPGPPAGEASPAPDQPAE